jgi:hypothetical protein
VSTTWSSSWVFFIVAWTCNGEVQVPAGSGCGLEVDERYSRLSEIMSRSIFLKSNTSVFCLDFCISIYLLPRTVERNLTPDKRAELPQSREAKCKSLTRNFHPAAQKIDNAGG